MTSKASRLIVLSSILIAIFTPFNLVLAQGQTVIEKHRSQEAGLPFIQNFTPKNYGQDAQNWAVVEDHRGVMYFGNNKGILEFDGVNWRLITTPTKSSIRSLAVDSSGRIFAGLLEDFGYLEPDSIGQMRFHSLKPLVENEENFGTVWKIHPTTHGIYFQTFSHLFRYANDQLKKIAPPPNLFHLSFVVRDTVYLNVRGLGLVRVEGDSLNLIPSGETFAKQGVYTMLPFGKRQILVGTSKGLLIYDGATFTSFQSNVNSFLKEKRVFAGTKLANGNYALGTLHGGLAIIDPKGQFLRILDKNSGLQDNDIKFMFTDGGGALWLALNKGISRVETSSPFTQYDETNGLEGIVLSVHRHQGEIYVATTKGVFYLQNRNAEIPQFLPIADIPYQSYSFLSDGERLLVATNYRVYVIQNHKATLIEAGWNGAFSMVRSKQNQDLIYVGGFSGFSALKLVNNKWIDAGKVQEIPERVETIIEASNGTLWLGTMESGAISLKIKSSADSFAVQNIKKFGSGKITPFVIANHVSFRTANGLRRLNDENLLVSDSSLGEMFADTLRAIHRMVTGSEGQVWIVTSKGKEFSLGVLQKNAQDFDWKSDIFERVKSIGEVRHIYYDQSGGDLVWFSGDNGIIRFNPNITAQSREFATLIRKVSLMPQDSLIFGGVGNLAIEPRFSYENNSVRVEYTATSYDDMSDNQFQYFLEGYNKNWSSWTNETQKDYTNLPEGDFQFRVRAKNVYEHKSQEAKYSFTILPPWHRTWWAYGGYFFILGLLLFAGDRFQRKRLLKKEQEKARQREEKFRLKNQLEIKKIEAEALKELDEMRSRFFANISHEFRTPLTLILGQIESLRAEIEKESHTQKLDMAMRHAKRLQELINQLLDVTKLEAGKMPLRARQENIVPFLNKLFSAFESLATQKKLGARLYAEQDGINVYYEAEKLEKIFVNLVSNAIKFTPEGGDVSASVKLAEIEEKDYVEIEVRDSGVGIPEDRLPYIFDRFYQIESDTTRDFEGTGIGLALAKELVELHHGTIQVDSKQGLGTVFKVSLPLGCEHLSDEEIAEHIEVLEDAAEKAPTIKKTKIPRKQDETTTDRPIVLVVEDNPDMSQYICETLASDYEIQEATDGDQGFEMAKELIPDLIISDVMMPKVDGYKMATKIRTEELTSHIPIVMLTAKAAEEDKLEGFETGVDAYLTKPFSTKELQVRVRKLIEMRQKLRKQQKQPLQITSSEVSVTSVDEQFLEKLKTIVEENMEDENFQVEELCSHVGIGERQLYRKLQALLECTPAAYIRLIRLDRAKQLLEKNAGTVSEITFQVGYTNTSAFARAFREVYGQSPSEFLKKGDG